MTLLRSILVLAMLLVATCAAGAVPAGVHDRHDCSDIEGVEWALSFDDQNQGETEPNVVVEELNDDGIAFSMSVLCPIDRAVITQWARTLDPISAPASLLRPPQ